MTADPSPVRPRYAHLARLFVATLALPFAACGDDDKPGGATDTVADADATDSDSTADSLPDTTDPELDTADTSAPDATDTSAPDAADTSEPDAADTSEPDAADTSDTDSSDVGTPPEVMVDRGAIGWFQIFDFGFFATQFDDVDIVRFSNSACVLWVVPADARPLWAGSLTLGGPAIGVEGALASETTFQPQACMGFNYEGPTFGLASSAALEVRFDGGSLPSMPTQVLEPSPLEPVEILAPVTDPFDIESLAPFDLSWTPPASSYPEQYVLFDLDVFSAAPTQPNASLHCAFPLDAGHATIPANVLEELAARFGSGGFGFAQIQVGGQALHDTAGASYLAQVTRLGSTNVPFLGANLLSELPPPEPPEEPRVEIPPAAGPLPRDAAHCSALIGGGERASVAGLSATPDGQGLVVAGSFAGSVSLGTLDAAQGFDATGGDDIYLARYDADCNLEWARAIGGVAADFATRVAIAPDGAIYLTGLAAAEVTFGAGEASEATVVAVGDSDLFLARFEANGDFTWVTTVSGEGNQVPQGLAVTPTGVYVTGQIRAGAILGDVIVAPGNGASGIAFIARYSAAGDLEWARVVGDGHANDVDFFAVAADGERALVTGNHRFPVTFGPGEPDEATTGPGCDVDAFIAHFDEDGVLARLVPFGGPHFDTPYGVAIDAAGRWLVAGVYPGNTVIGDIAIANGGPASATFVGIYDEGIAARAISLGGPHFDTNFSGIAPTPDGGFAVLGNYGAYDGEGYTILGAGEPEETVLVSAGARDGFLARYDAAGDLRWARSFGSASGNELLARIAVSPTGDVLVGGSFDSPLSFDDAVLVPRGSTEGFVVVFR